MKRMLCKLHINGGEECEIIEEQHNQAKEAKKRQKELKQEERVRRKQEKKEAKMLQKQEEMAQRFPCGAAATRVGSNRMLTPAFVTASDATDTTDSRSSKDAEEERLSESFSLDPIEDLVEWENHKKYPDSLGFPTYVAQSIVKRVMVVYNPKSGAKKGTKLAHEAVTLFQEAGVEVEAFATEYRGHGEEIVAKHPNLSRFSVLCFLGGDGTLHECINGLMKRSSAFEREIPVALMAGGTGNSFVLELPSGASIKSAVRHVLRGLHCPIDLSKVSFGDGSSCFSFNSIHWGLGSRVNVVAEKLRWMGSVRYTTASLYEVFHGETTLAKIELIDRNDEHITYEEEFCLTIANNIMTAGKGRLMAPCAKLNDGLMDLLIIRSNKAMDLMAIFTKLHSGRHAELSAVEYRQVKYFSITPFKKPKHHHHHFHLHHHHHDDENTVHEIDTEEIIDVDGELKGCTPFSVQVLPLALRVIV